MSWIPAANWVEAWIRSMGRASLDGSLAVVGAWLICRFLPRMSPTARSWIWRCVYLKLVLLLLWPGAIPVPLFRDPGVSLGRPQSLLPAGAQLRQMQGKDFDGVARFRSIQDSWAVSGTSSTSGQPSK